MATTKTNKSLLLIGPGEHFGLHLIRKFATEGYAIGVISQNKHKLDQLADCLRLENIHIVTAAADVRDFQATKKAVDTLVPALPTLACVIFNVKKSPRGSWVNLDTFDFCDALATNVGGALNCVKATAPYLKNTVGASVIITGGGYKDNPDPNKLALSVSKGAVHTLYQAVAAGLREEGITIKTIVIDGVVREEGPIRSREVANLFWDAHLDHERTEFYCH